jgi:hypothetical protein
VVAFIKETRLSEGDGAMDLGATLRDAVQAAQRGDVDALELELALLRHLDSHKVGEIGTRLRTMARCVQAHPAFKARPAAQTG